MLAERWHVQQPSIAKREKRTDMHISTLRSHIEAMDGQLEVVARFQDGSVKISNVAESEAAPQQAQVFYTLSTAAIPESKNPRNSLGKSGV